MKKNGKIMLFNLLLVTFAGGFLGVFGSIYYLYIYLRILLSVKGGGKVNRRCYERYRFCYNKLSLSNCSICICVAFADFVMTLYNFNHNNEVYKNSQVFAGLTYP